MPITSWQRHGRLVLMCLLVLLFASSVLIPSAGLAWVRVQWPFLSMLLGYLEVITTDLDLLHIIAAGLLAVGLRLLRPQCPAWRLWCYVLIGSLLTELIQFWIPGRTPLYSDIRDNLLGCTLGLGLVSALFWIYTRTYPRNRAVG